MKTTKSDQLNKARTNNQPLIELYHAQGFQIEMYAMEDDYKVWSVMLVESNGKQIGAHIFQDGKMINNLINNK